MLVGDPDIDRSSKHPKGPRPKSRPFCISQQNEDLLKLAEDIRQIDYPGTVSLIASGSPKATLRVGLASYLLEVT